MHQQPNASIIKHPFILALVALAIILSGSIVYLSWSKKQVSPSSRTQTSRSETESVNSENPTYGHVHALFRNPVDRALLLGSHNCLFKSSDEGKTFTKVDVKGDATVMDFMNFAYDPNTKTLFAGGHDVGVVKSIDGGVTWIKTDSGMKGTDIHALVINPIETNHMYAFSVDNGVFGTKDSGESWARIDDGPVNPSVRAFGYMATPSSMDRSMKTDNTTNIGYLWAGTGGGLYSSFACFCGWTKTTGISDNATIYTLAPDPVNRSSMLAGTKDGIFKTTDEGKTFIRITSDIKNIASIIFDPLDPKIVFAATSDALIYKSQNSGNSFSKMN